MGVEGACHTYKKVKAQRYAHSRRRGGTYGARGGFEQKSGLLDLVFYPHSLSLTRRHAISFLLPFCSAQLLRLSHIFTVLKRRI